MNDRRGFTLAETLASLFVLAVLLYAGSASFFRLIPKARLEAAVWEISSKLNEARNTALLEGVPVRWKAVSGGYILEKHVPEEGAWKRISGRSIPGAAVRANNSPTFYPQGTVSNLATIYVENSRGRYRITMAITGRIKISKA
jgi:prepilin-type N-terminal cleavage/methylation domain-containing protein